MNDFDPQQQAPPQRTAASSAHAPDDHTNTNSSSSMNPPSSASANRNANKPTSSSESPPDEDMDSSHSPNSLSNETGGPDSATSSPVESSSSSTNNINNSSNTNTNNNNALTSGSSASNSSASPVRRLPSVLRPPPSASMAAGPTTTTTSASNANSGPSTSSSRNPAATGPSGGGSAGGTAGSSTHLLAQAQQQRQLYGAPTSTGSPYGAPINASGTMSMRSYYAHPMSGGDPQQTRSGGGYDRIHPQQQQSNGSPASGLRGHESSPRDDDMDSDSSPRGQKRRLAPYDARAAYDARATASHRNSSSSSSHGSQSAVATALAVASALSRHDQQQQQQQQRQAYEPSSQQQQLQQHTIHAHDDDEDEASSTQFGDAPRGSHGPRDELRYETWTSKQLRKKCSHLKLRGLKNVKKHVMVDALYRYYRTQRQKELLGVPNNSSSTSAKTQATDARPSQSNSSNGNDPGRGTAAAMTGRYDHHTSPSSSAAAYSSSAATSTMNRSRAATIGSDRSHHHNHHNTIGSHSSAASSSSLLTRKASNTSGTSGGGATNSAAAATASSRAPAMVVRHRTTSYNDDDDDDDAMDGRARDGLDNEIHVTSEDVIRLVDVVLSPVFVDRLAVELSRWQFWVDVREKYIAALKTHPVSNYSQYHHPHDVLNRSMHMSMLSSRNFKWSSMQLWEIWKELTFAYTKTCFEFTAAGSDDRDYINFCEGRPDVYYLHQRLHARPDLLHLIKSNEYIEEKATSDASESIAHESNSVPLVGTAAGNSGASTVSPGTRAHKRFKRIVPAPSAHLVAPGYSQSAGPNSASGNGASGAGPSGNATNSNNNNGSSNAGTTTTSGATSQNLSSSSGTAPRRSNARDFLVNTTSSDTSPGGEDGSGGNGGSTETSETTGEEMSVGKKSSSASESQQMREVLAEQKYFGLLLQNFEAIFESLHNKKVLLAALRKDPNAPDHLIADLHDDIHVLSALKKEFRNKLRHTLE